MFGSIEQYPPRNDQLSYLPQQNVFKARNQLTERSLSYMSIEKNFEKKIEIYEKKMKFAKFCLGDHSLIEESNLPGLVL